MGMVRGENCCWLEADMAAFSETILAENRHHGVVFYGADLRIRGWSLGAAFITGWSDQEVLGQSTAMLFTPEDRERQLHVHEAELARQLGAAEDERWHIRKDGSRYWSSGVSVPLHDAGGVFTGFAKVFRDTTHLRTRMKYLENELQQSKAAHRQRHTFLGTIAHEMRNPLGPLHMVLELMKRSPDESQRHREMVRVMDRQLGFLVRLIEDLVDLTRVQSGKMSIGYERVELQRLLTDTLDSVRDSAAAKGVAVHPLLPPVPMEVEVDAQRLHQVVVNLLGNAIKFTPSGGQVWLTATADQTHFLVQVKDTGRGIAPELLPQIFDVFTQAEGASSGRGAGLGIGLSVVKEIVALHQGTVEVRSQGLGKGSEFILRIPLCKPNGSGPEPLAPPEHRGAHDGE